MSDPIPRGGDASSEGSDENVDSGLPDGLPPKDLPEELLLRRLGRLDTRRALTELCKTVPGLDEILLPRGIQAAALTRKSGGSAQMLRGLARKVTQAAAAWGAFRTAIQQQLPPETFEVLQDFSPENLEDLARTHTTEGLLLAALSTEEELGEGVVESLIGAGRGREAGLRGRPDPGPRGRAGAPQAGERAALFRLPGRQRAGGCPGRGGRGPDGRARGRFPSGENGRGARRLGPRRTGPARRAHRRARETWNPAGAGAGERALGLFQGRRARRRAARGARARGRGARPYPERPAERPVHRQGVRRAPGAGGQERGRRPADLPGFHGPVREAAGVHGQGAPGAQ